MELAKRANRITGDRGVGYMDTLAASYAATGEFILAVEMAQRAVEGAKAAGESGGAIEAMAARLEGYRRGEAYHER